MSIWYVVTFNWAKEQKNNNQPTSHKECVQNLGSRSCGTDIWQHHLTIHLHFLETLQLGAQGKMGGVSPPCPSSKVVGSSIGQSGGEEEEEEDSSGFSWGLWVEEEKVQIYIIQYVERRRAGERGRAGRKDVVMGEPSSSLEGGGTEGSKCEDFSTVHCLLCFHLTSPSPSKVAAIPLVNQGRRGGDGFTQVLQRVVSEE